MTATEPLRAHGLLHSATFDGTTIWVYRGRKQINAIPVAQLVDVRLNPGIRAITNGSIRFYVPAGMASEVVFTRGKLDQFQALFESVQRARTQASPPPVEPSFALQQAFQLPQGTLQPSQPPPLPATHKSGTERLMDGLMAIQMGAATLYIVAATLLMLGICGFCGWALFAGLTD